MRPIPRYARALAFAAALALAACATAPAPVGEPARPMLDRVLARLVARGEWDKASRAEDSVLASPDPSGREIALYWKSVALLFRDEPDSAAAILEAQQGKWTAGLRKVHGALLLKLARQAGASRAASRSRPEEAVPARPPAPDKALQERVESLQKESSDLRAENLRLETEKEKYQKLLKDLETIR